MNRVMKYSMLAVIGCSMLMMDMPQAEARRYVRRVVTPNYRRTVVRNTGPNYRAPRYNNRAYYNRGFYGPRNYRGPGVSFGGSGWNINIRF